MIELKLQEKTPKTDSNIKRAEIYIENNKRLIKNNNPLAINLMEDIIKDYETYLDILYKLIKLRFNSVSISNHIEPYNGLLHCTPQGGEYELHSQIMSNFLQINKSYYE